MGWVTSLSACSRVTPLRLRVICFPETLPATTTLAPLCVARALTTSTMSASTKLSVSNFSCGVVDAGDIAGTALAGSATMRTRASSPPVQMELTLHVLRRMVLEFPS
ncbi:hypothetical protein AMK68_00510 [candidate division KD3-62 bacterium DG_56]|uniref:Uncharacterized protein n=1 Tax=candidate division KD3-62 bacterium DG_56 TaxID=1704032 RepID=A0A0S7XRE4_9BACT|nr:MAG: hypothetical protein AMK68_00510 [candidate division KD3-62 bacterium DG_56]